MSDYDPLDMQIEVTWRPEIVVKFPTRTEQFVLASALTEPEQLWPDLSCSTRLPITCRGDEMHVALVDGVAEITESLHDQINEAGTRLRDSLLLTWDGLKGRAK